jgi:hypothetical protein
VFRVAPSRDANAVHAAEVAAEELAHSLRVYAAAMASRVRFYPLRALSPVVWRVRHEVLLHERCSDAMSKQCNALLAMLQAVRAAVL